MHFDIEQAIKYPFQEKDWIRKAGVIFIIQIVLFTLINSFRFLGQFSQGFFDFFPSDVDTVGIYAALFAPYLIVFVLQILALPFYAYIAGYMLETRKNVMEGEELPVPENTNFGYKFKLALSAFLVALGPMLSIMLVSMFVMIPLVIVGIAFSDGGLGPVLLLIGMIFIWFLLFLMILAVAILVIPSMLYIYLKTNSITDAYNFSAVYLVIKAAWKRMIVVMLLVYAVTMMANLLSLVLCFISFIVTPAIQTWVMFVEANLMGNVYKQLDDEGVLEFESGA